ncbi:MAG: BASS family bile acid:Na+ symporter [Bacteroidia bacterium]|jgi:BASS family bile acid:Na+ symporter
MYESLQALDSVKIDFNSSSQLLLNFAIAFIMFGVALELKIDHFTRLFNKPKPAIVGAISQFVMMPLMTIILAIAFRNYITMTVGLGMVLVAACPGGNISNFMCNLAKGNVALSVSLTAVSDLGALILTPFNFAFWGNIFVKVYTTTGHADLVQPLHIDPFHVFTTILLILGLPLMLGLFVNHKFPKTTLRMVVFMKRASMVIFIAILVVIFVKNFDLFLKHIKYIALLVFIQNTLAFLLGYNFARLFKLSKKDRKTISIETGIQNTGLALALLFNPKIFDPTLAIGGMTFIAAWWGAWHIIAGLSLASFWARRAKRLEEG